MAKKENTIEKKTSRWRKVKKKIIDWLSDDEQQELVPEGETPGAPVVSHDPGLNCPQCSYKIKINMEVLMSGSPIVCPACGLELGVDQEKSKGCINELRKVSDAIQKAEEAKNVI
ncbi:MAG: hypothetical protein KAS57_06085 [Gammaproteobacteria bacterium]|nr:hypothetical protein [Gammaproteobacteria bacterium]